MYIGKVVSLFKFILKVTKEKVESSGFVRQVFPVFPVIDNCLKFLNIKCNEVVVYCYCTIYLSNALYQK